jgi:hypothetical protein
MTVTVVHAPHKLDGSVHCPTNQIFGSELKLLDCGLDSSTLTTCDRAEISISICLGWGLGLGLGQGTASVDIPESPLLPKKTSRTIHR